MQTLIKKKLVFKVYFDLVFHDIEKKYIRICIQVLDHCATPTTVCLLRNCHHHHLALTPRISHIKHEKADALIVFSQAAKSMTGQVFH